MHKTLFASMLATGLVRLGLGNNPGNKLIVVHGQTSVPSGHIHVSLLRRRGRRRQRNLPVPGAAAFADLEPSNWILLSLAWTHSLLTKQFLD
jgi:hypothetical protein